MNFMQWLNSLDELLYEIMSWLIFFPVTLWRSLRHPLRMMSYARNELADRPEEQFTDTLSPPLFLALALLVSHGLELALGGGVNPIVARTDGLAGLVTDDTSLLVLRLIVFALFPLLFAARMVKAQGAKLTKQSLKAPFYSQCYSAAPFALFLGAGVSLTHVAAPRVAIAGGVIVTLTILAYLVVQSLWFSRRLGISLAQGGMRALGAFFLATLSAVMIAFLFSG